MMFPQSSLPAGPKVESKKALLLLDFQQDFTEAKDGRLYVANTTQILRKLPDLVNKFRETAQIIWVNTTFDRSCSSLSQNTGSYQIVCKDLAEYVCKQLAEREVSSSSQGVPDSTSSRRSKAPKLLDDEDAFLGAHIPVSSRCCIPESEGCRMSTDLVPVCDPVRDLVLTKTQYSALADFATIMRFRMRMISDLYICGSLSNIGVYATVLDAVQQGFNVTLVEDCLGFRHDLCHIEAMRRMADDLGANGTDCQELMDDLCGLLGEVIPASRYTRKFQLSMQPTTLPDTSLGLQKATRRAEDVEEAIEQPIATANAQSSRSRSNNHNAAGSISAHTLSEDDSSVQPKIRESSPRQSPSRKRPPLEREESNELSINNTDLEDIVAFIPSSKARQSDKPSKKTKTNPILPTGDTESAFGSIRQEQELRASQAAKSTSHIDTVRKHREPQPAGTRTMSEPNPAWAGMNRVPKKKIKKPKHNVNATYRGSEDIIGAGDTKVVYDILPNDIADKAFHALKKGVAWQKMYHRTGEVPRLVAVQGEIEEDGSMPIYRHPADESPPLLAFDDEVNALRRECEKVVGHRLNHVLIQHYRSSEDNISEHSDKTLDIVRGSSIVNLSLGAMRTMTLRGKRSIAHGSAQDADTAKKDKDGNGARTESVLDHAPETNHDVAPRTAQRIRLPHNSIFVLGELTNANYLHSIRADKRPDIEKSSEELAFDGERISLTFRNIGTFLNVEKQVIWGQGSTGKTKAHARKILDGKDTELAEKLIIGFGKENHLADADFDWDEVYGEGFDIVNFEVIVKDTDPGKQ